MEIKKSNQANLDNKRITYFLLGLIFVLSFVYIGLEYNYAPGIGEHSFDLSDDIFQELDMQPVQEKKDMIVAALPASAPSTTHKIKVVEATAQQSENIDRHNGPQTDDGLGEGDQQQESPSTTPPPLLTDNADNPQNFRIVQQLPEFPGGIVEFMKWLQRHLQYPEEARQKRIQGKVMVSFIVNKDGSITDAKVTRSVNPQLDGEAMRVINLMPKWKPGVDNGKPCRTLFAIPIVFKL